MPLEISPYWTMVTVGVGISLSSITFIYVYNKKRKDALNHNIVDEMLNHFTVTDWKEIKNQIANHKGHMMYADKKEIMSALAENISETEHFVLTWMAYKINPKLLKKTTLKMYLYIKTAINKEKGDKKASRKTAYAIREMGNSFHKIGKSDVIRPHINSVFNQMKAEGCPEAISVLCYIFIEWFSHIIKKDANELDRIRAMSLLILYKKQIYSFVDCINQT